MKAAASLYKEGNPPKHEGETDNAYDYQPDSEDDESQFSSSTEEKQRIHERVSNGSQDSSSTEEDVPPITHDGYASINRKTPRNVSQHLLKPKYVIPTKENERLTTTAASVHRASTTTSAQPIKSEASKLPSVFKSITINQEDEQLSSLSTAVKEASTVKSTQPTTSSESASKL